MPASYVATTQNAGTPNLNVGSRFARHLVAYYPGGACSTAGLPDARLQNPGAYSGSVSRSSMQVMGRNVAAPLLSGGYISLGTNATLKPASITVSAWVRLDSLSPTYTAIYSARVGTEYLQLFVKSNGKLAVYALTSTGAGNYDGTGTYTLAAGTAYHLVLTRDGVSGVMTAYVNGQQDGTATAIGTYSALLAAETTLGQDTGTAGRRLAGTIANVAVYSKAFTASEVTSLYREPWQLLAAQRQRLWVPEQIVVPPAEEEAPRRGAAGIVSATVNGRTFVGTRDQLERLLAALAAEHAQEDEAQILAPEAPKKRAIRVLGPAKVTSKPAEAQTLTIAPAVVEQTGIDKAEAEAIYRRAYAKAMEQEILRRDDEDVAHVTEQIRRRRQMLGNALLERLLAIKDMLH